MRGDFLTVKKVIEQGYLGDLVDITVNMDHFRPNDASQGGNFDGAWYGHGVHLVDQMVSLFGTPEEVQYDIRATRDYDSVDDYFSAHSGLVWTGQHLRQTGLLTQDRKSVV